MWLGMLSAALGGPLSAVLNALTALPLAYLAWLARAAAAMPSATVGVALPNAAAVAAAYAALAGLVIVGPHASRRTLAALGVHGGGASGPGVPRRVARHRLAALTVLALVASAWLLAACRPPAPPGVPTMSVLAVGQGDATLLQDGPHAMLVDTGPPGGPVVAELRAAGVRRLDAVLLTHSAADHEGGLPAVLRAVPVGLVVDGRGRGAARGGEGGARFAGLPPSLPRAVAAAGEVLRVGRIRVDVLWPPPGDSRLGDPNDTAAVALVTAGRTKALLTADAESNVTLPLHLPHVDVLKVAHHGSDDQGLPLLLKRLTPSVAVIPVGPNTYGHPRPETLRALRAAVRTVRRTDRDGTVRIRLG
jgi:competence protein ComEC